MGENKEYLTHPDEKGSINISDEVVAAIAANAALEVEGVAGLPTSLGKDIAEMLGRRNLSRGVKLLAEEDGITLDICINVAYGVSVSEVAKAVQAGITAAVESTTGFSVKAVNVHVCGIAFENK
jgi:uncharacterized alkaline shock family protein YloU